VRALALPVSLLAPPLCAACGGDAGAAAPLCGGCRAELVGLGHEQPAVAGASAWAPFGYSGPARSLVGALKFGGVRSAAAVMAAQIVACAPGGLLAGALVPVPLHPVRAARRGFNQADLIARELASRTGLPLLDCLQRLGPPTRQVGRDRAGRALSISGRIAVAAGTSLPHAVAVVDDVITTGSTIAACAEALRRAGAAHATAVAYARTLAR
jgi:ComF family protein